MTDQSVKKKQEQVVFCAAADDYKLNIVFPPSDLKLRYDIVSRQAVSQWSSIVTELSWNCVNPHDEKYTFWWQNLWDQPAVAGKAFDGL